MYFVHPQIKKENLKEVFQSFFKRPDLDFLKERFSFYFPGKNFVFCDMGRTGFKIIIEKLNLKNSQILMPAFICDIFWPILKQYKITPIFLDVDLKTFHIQFNQIKEKMTPQTKAILICHTFGLPVDIEKVHLELQRIFTSETSHIHIIEDCAHSFGAKCKNIFVGNLGQISFFSLYKQFPSLRGGLLIFNSANLKVESEKGLAKTSFGLRDFVSLLNSFSPFAFLFKKLGKDIAPKMIKKEKFSAPAGINKISLNLFSFFLEDFEKNLEKRIKLARLYQKELQNLGFELQEGRGNIFCYLSALVPKRLKEKRDEIVEKLRKYNVFCTRIWRDPIILNSAVQKECKINLNDYPNTLEAAKRILNFPLQNFFEEKDIKKIIFALKEVLAKVS